MGRATAPGRIDGETTMKTIPKYLFTAIGLIMLAGALFWIQNVRTFIAKASAAQGTVVDLARSDTVYRPVVRFNAAGRQIEFIPNWGTNPPIYSRGEKVEILYQAGNPEKAQIKGFFSLWGGPLIVGGSGAVFFLVGGSTWFVSHRATLGASGSRRRKSRYARAQRPSAPIDR
jgi:hypothetical protein